MKKFEQDGLLREILYEDGLSKLRQISLQQGLDSLRRKRARRFTGNVLAVVLLLAAIIGLHFSRMPNRNVPANQTTLAPQSIAGIKVISDEELFALFPNRSMALIGQPGHQQLLFFTKPTK